MNSIIEAYQDLNFSDYERKRLSELDTQLKILDKYQKIHERKRNSIEEKISATEKAKRECWSKASKLQDRLQKRCKHLGSTYHSERYRDFGNNIVRTHCGFCHKIITEREKDC